MKPPNKDLPALASLHELAHLSGNVQQLIAGREKLYRWLREEIPWLRPYPSQANFILCKVIGRDAGRLRATLAAREGIAVQVSPVIPGVNSSGSRDTTINPAPPPQPHR